MTEVHITINIREGENYDSVAEMMEGFPMWLEQNLIPHLMPIMSQIQAEAQATTTFRDQSGSLRAHISVVLGGDLVSNQGMVTTIPTIVAIVNDVEYASYQEFGTVHMDAKMFMTDAFDNHRQDIQDAIKDCIEEYWRTH